MAGGSGAEAARQVRDAYDMPPTGRPARYSRSRAADGGAVSGSGEGSVMGGRKASERLAAPVHARTKIVPDAAFETALAAHLRSAYSPADLEQLYARFGEGAADFDARMRRTILRALARRFGNGAAIGRGVRFRHAETFSVGDGVAVGDGAIIHGRAGGRCAIGRRVWIGPQCFLDARDLAIEDFVGIGPGVRILGSTHTGEPLGVPVMATPLRIRRVVLGRGSDIGTGAVILPGVRVGRGAIIGAGAVVTRDVPDFAIAAGVPARVLRGRGRSALPRG